MIDSFNYLLKVIVIGDSGVGKTNLLLRFVNHTFQDDLKSTIGVQFFTKVVSMKNEHIKLQLWDTAGQERYRSISTTYYKGSHGVIICFDLTHQDSLDNVVKWYEEVKQQADLNVKIILIGNKLDLSQQRVVGSDTAQQVAKQIGAGYIETSALTSQNVEKAFELLIQEIYMQLKQLKQDQQSHKITTDNSIVLTNKKETSSSQKRNTQCC
ncbi:unnamed protein product [Paramecium sonneborni]|uniref:Uncharacterized protein n=1 Tax=Paramecium sonneborni TaxID=65129 RepID=A0A8S1KN46_9CILI|nr:unnamed protein product [Paramecium sonneborni]